jgi:hypothetical protein
MSGRIVDLRSRYYHLPDGARTRVVSVTAVMEQPDASSKAPLEGDGAAR